MELDSNGKLSVNIIRYKLWYWDSKLLYFVIFMGIFTLIAIIICELVCCNQYLYLHYEFPNIRIKYILIIAEIDIHSYCPEQHTLYSVFSHI